MVLVLSVGLPNSISTPEFFDDPSETPRQGLCNRKKRPFGWLLWRFIHSFNALFVIHSNEMSLLIVHTVVVVVVVFHGIPVFRLSFSWLRINLKYFSF